MTWAGEVAWAMGPGDTVGQERGAVGQGAGVEAGLPWVRERGSWRGQGAWVVAGAGWLSWVRGARRCRGSGESRGPRGGGGSVGQGAEAVPLARGGGGGGRCRGSGGCREPEEVRLGASRPRNEKADSTSYL